MTCIDCLHCEICDYWYDAAYSTEPEEWDGQICKYFKNKSNFVELPCVIGQPVWKLFIWPRNPAEILDGRVSMIQQKADRSWKIRISTKYGTEDFKYEDFGKWVFLTKEAAFRAGMIHLMELEDEGELSGLPEDYDIDVIAIPKSKVSDYTLEFSGIK